MAFVMVAAFAGCGEKDNSSAGKSVVPASSVASTVEESSEVASVTSEEESTVQSSAPSQEKESSVVSEEPSTVQSSIQSQEEESSAQVEDSRSESSVGSGEASVITDNSSENSVVTSAIEDSIVDDILTASNNPKRASREDAIAYGRIINDTTSYIMLHDKKYNSSLFADDYVYVISISENNYVGILLDGFVHPVNYSDIEVFPSDYVPDFDHHIWLF